MDEGVARKLKVEEHTYAVRKIIYDGHKNNYVPTVKCIQEKIAEFTECCLDAIRTLLGKIGFDYNTE